MATGDQSTRIKLTPEQRQQVLAAQAAAEAEKAAADQLKRLFAELKAARTFQKLSLRELGRRTGLDASHISRMERGAGATPSPASVMRVARALGLQLHQQLKPQTPENQ